MALQESLASIAETIADYREGEIARPTAAHVGTWVNQFPNAVREPLAAEMAHVLRNTYISKPKVAAFLRGLLKNEKLTGPNAAPFWRETKFLDIQRGGRSQHEMLAMLDPILKQDMGLDRAACGANPTRFVYIDDGLFTGNRILGDFRDWITNTAPAQADVFVIVIALHRGGRYYAEGKLNEAAKAAGKKITFHWWCIIGLEDRKAYTNNSDVLRLTQVPDEARSKAYVATLKYGVNFRRPPSVGEHKVFSSEEGRFLLEQEFFKAGTLIREQSPRLTPYQRPLGNMLLETPGFGSTIVTFRNCPNNAPLAFWAGNPWYPLFPRKTN